MHPGGPVSLVPPPGQSLAPQRAGAAWARSLRATPCLHTSCGQALPTPIPFPPDSLPILPFRLPAGPSRCGLVGEGRACWLRTW